MMAVCFFFMLLLLGTVSTSQAFSQQSIRPSWSHYSTIGHGLEKFPGEETDQREILLWKSLLENREFTKQVNDDPVMLLNKVPSGAEMWCAIDNQELDNQELLEFEPHFFGSSRVSTKVTAVNNPWSALEAWIKASVNGGFPIEFACPNYAMHKDMIKSDALVDIQLAAIAEEITTFDTLDKYEEENSKMANAADLLERNPKNKPGLAMASKSFCLASVFDQNMICRAMFTGHVVETEQKVNEMTGEPFYWALVETLMDIPIDVVMDPNCLTHVGCKMPKVGGVLQGSFWLSGRIVL